MRTVYLGTTDFAVTVLERLAESDHRPGLVVTRPDRARGRGRRVQSPPVAEAARGIGIELAQPDDVNAEPARERIAEAQPDAVCICAFGALLREPLLSGHPMYNVHPSLLPRWRGAAPIERAIEAGDPETGVSIMRPIAELDAGPVYLSRGADVRPDDDYASLAARLAPLAGDLLVEALSTRPEPREQPEEGVTYAEKISSEERRLDPGRPAESLARTVRALTPHVGAWVDTGDGGRLGVRHAAAVPAGEAGPDPGRLAADGERLLFGCAGGQLELLEVQPPGGKAMPAADYLRGHAGVPAGRGGARGG